MSFFDKIEQLSKKITTHQSSIATEEATKNALIMPFLHSVLEYDIFNPEEVIPEFTTDHGIRKGEKVDYAIVLEGDVQILVECKKIGDSLSSKHASQFFRYFSVTNARIAILTNGAQYQFYTDLDKSNQMDTTPFLEFDLMDINENALPELSKLTKSSFDLRSIISAAGELKYLEQIKRRIARQFTDPSDEFVKFFTSQVYGGVITQKVREQFHVIVKKAAQQFLVEKINDRLKSAMQNEDVDIEECGDQVTVKEKIITTAEELEGYFIIKAILREVIDIKRVIYRDTQSYFGILLDDNNRKPLCRLHFNRKQKYISIFDQAREEIKHPLETLNDIFNYALQLRATAKSYE